MPPKTPIHVVFDRFGRDVGMELHHRAWFLRTDEVIVTCALQKSQYSPLYYLNVGYYLRSKGSGAYPRSSECHITYRAGELIGRERAFDELLDLEHLLDDEARVDQLYSLLITELAPLHPRSGYTATLMCKSDAHSSMSQYATDFTRKIFPVGNVTRSTRNS